MVFEEMDKNQTINTYIWKLQWELSSDHFVSEDLVLAKIIKAINKEII